MMILLQTSTHVRIIVNILVGFMLGSLFIDTGKDGFRQRDNYNMLFCILIHHLMSTMMLTVLTCKCKKKKKIF